MIISLWRWCHLALAVSSFLLLTLASLTGIVLAFEPVMEKAKEYKAEGFDDITLAQTIPALKEKLKGLQELKVDDNDVVIATFSGEDDIERTAYVHPLTGAILGEVKAQSPFFKWMTALHRSLFLHETGRGIVGITSFLLILIAITGVALIIKRQRGIRRFFAPVEKTHFAQYYHTVFGRAVLLFILALAATGTFLSVSRFILKPELKTAVVNEEDIKEEPERKLKDFALFQQTALSQVKSIQFPFSDFPEDYYTIKLKDREWSVNQFTGDVLAQQLYPTSHTLTNFSLRWHTGRSSAVWAVIMAITSGYILFFIYSGLVITWRRISGLSKNKYKAANSEIIILVGSENGSTFRFASAVYKQLLDGGKKVFLTDMNKYTAYPKAAHFIIMASTYGEGDPPSNAAKFLEALAAHPQGQPVQFSVIGFGSRSYQHFCKFAHDVQHVLQQQLWATPVMKLMTVDDGSPQDFANWLAAYTAYTGFNLSMPQNLLKQEGAHLQTLRVVQKTTSKDDAFIIQLAAKRNNKIRSGDLLAIYPKKDHRERLYSVGKVDGTLQLSVKRHQHGLGSTFLSSLQEGDEIRARFVKNEHFHFPAKAKKVLMVCNGTGIAPFLGMISEHKNGSEIELYCGFQTKDSFNLYAHFLQQQIDQRRLKHYHLALSREENRQYVSSLLQQHGEMVKQLLAEGGVVMLCGSVSMEKDVVKLIEHITGLPAEHYRERGQLLTDCY